MGTRTKLSRIAKTGRVEINWSGTWTQLDSTEEEYLTAPIKLVLDSSYIGTIDVALSNSDSAQIRQMNPGETHYFDEVNSPHKLYIKPSDIDVGKYLIYRYGVY